MEVKFATLFGSGSSSQLQAGHCLAAFHRLSLLPSEVAFLGLSSWTKIEGILSRRFVYLEMQMTECRDDDFGGSSVAPF